MTKMTYYLRKKNKNQTTLKKADDLRSGIKDVLEQISDLGYDIETVKEISSILHRRNGHDVFLKENKENETILLVRHYSDWKPAFHYGNGYDNLNDMEKWYRMTQSVYEIVYEEVNEKEKEKVEKVLTWDQFVSSVRSYEWAKFGMPLKYNKEENTIWDYLR